MGLNVLFVFSSCSLRGIQKLQKLGKIFGRDENSV